MDNLPFKNAEYCSQLDATPSHLVPYTQPENKKCSPFWSQCYLSTLQLICT